MWLNAAWYFTSIKYVYTHGGEKIYTILEYIMKSKILISQKHIAWWCLKIVQEMKELGYKKRHCYSYTDILDKKHHDIM